MTFDEYKETGGMIPNELEVNVKTLGASNDINDHFVNLLVFQSQLKIMHWGTESYAQHKAYMKAYDSIDEGLDALVESYQGRFGIVRGFKQPMTIREDNDPIPYFEALRKYVEINKYNFTQTSYVQNQVDEIMSLIESTLYKLKNLK
jgi:hypothetical protein